MRLYRLRINSDSSGFWEGHDFSRAVKSLKICLRFSARGEPLARLASFSAACLGAVFGRSSFTTGCLAGHARTIVFQQTPFALNRTERSQVLGQLHRPQIASVGIPHSKITDVYELVMKVDPKFRDVLSPGAKIVQNPVDRLDTSRRVAVLHLASDDGLAAREDAIRAFGEKGHAVVGIDEREVKREG